MTKTIAALSLLTASTAILSCTKDTVPVETQDYGGLVDERLIPYYLTFEEEAAQRGITVDFNAFPVTGAIKSIQEDDIAGTCNYHSYEPNVVTIDLEYWNSSSSLRRELVVFHELGHCYLGRDHLEASFDNGICTTIMNSGTSGCLVAYTAENRDYYLDELFK